MKNYLKNYLLIILLNLFFVNIYSLETKSTDSNNFVSTTSTPPSNLHDNTLLSNSESMSNENLHDLNELFETESHSPSDFKKFKEQQEAFEKAILSLYATQPQKIILLLVKLSEDDEDAIIDFIKELPDGILLFEDCNFDNKNKEYERAFKKALSNFKLNLINNKL